MEQLPAMLITEEVAALCNVSRSTVIRWALVGKLRYVRPFGKYLYPSDQLFIQAMLIFKEETGTEWRNQNSSP